MDRRILLVAVLVVLAGAVVMVTQPGGDTGDYGKIMVIRTTISDAPSPAPSVEIRYGHPPVSGLRTGSLLGEISGNDGRTVRQFAVWDPRVQVGEGVPDDGNGSIQSRQVTSSTADIVLILPYTGEEAGFRLFDRATGRTLAAANLTDAAMAFAGTYPADPVVRARTEGQFRLPQDPQILVLETGIALFTALVVVSFLMVRGRGKK